MQTGTLTRERKKRAIERERKKQESGGENQRRGRERGREEGKRRMPSALQVAASA
jgi:hypothetical protein